MVEQLVLLAVLVLPAVPVVAQNPVVAANDNRTPAGTLRAGTLSIRLVAMAGHAYPEGRNGPAITIEAFAEEGHAPQTPGPLIRVPRGTHIQATVRNALDRPMMLRGLYDRSSRPDSVELEPGETRELQFVAGRAGTFFYWGRTRDTRQGVGQFEDGQLLGGLVVEEPGTPVPDRLLILARWTDPADSTPPPTRRRRHTYLVNGLSWPHTERLTARVGDTLHWRVINASTSSHPMHLHGFYFDILARGNAGADSIYTHAEQRLAVTELMQPGETMAMRWVPRREGNWMFHCHFIAHLSTDLRLGKTVGDAQLPPGAEHAKGGHNHAIEGMAGLASGILITAGKGGLPPENPRANRRKLRLYANERDNFFGASKGFGFILQSGARAPALDSVRVPGSPIVLTRGEPVEITVLNRIKTPISLHWHGIELEAYYDGVAGWSGDAKRLAPLIMPGDSFRVWMTPDRAGTFIYHTHAEEGQQLAAGLYGPLVILEPGQRWDREADRVFMLGWAGSAAQAAPILNGEAAPAPLQLRAGKTYRLRFINIMPSARQTIELTAGDAPAQWRIFAKDGAYLPPQQAMVRPAVQLVGSGETFDFEFTPARATSYMLTFTASRGNNPPARLQVPVIVN